MNQLFIRLGLCLIGLNLAVAQQQRQCCEEYCYDTDGDKPQSAHFGSKTAYQISKGSDSERQYFVPNCKPVKLWILSRDGTSLPRKNEMKDLMDLSRLREEIIKNYEERQTKPDQGALCEEDLDLIKHWNWPLNISETYESYLTVQGWEDSKYLAINYQRAFPALVDTIYTPEKFLFRHLKTQATEASYKAFLEGLFGSNAYEHISLSAQPDDDLLLKPYEKCPSWQQYVNDKENTQTEVYKYEESQEFQKVIGDISQRLGFKFALKVKQVKTIFDMCRYEQAWNLDRPSAWCTAFTKSQVNYLEYSEDLKNYYEAGYGRQVNSRLACRTVTDMLKHLESTTVPNVIAYFTKAPTVQLFLTALGAAKDDIPLTADSYQQNMRRKWKTSQQLPFGANLAAIKYDCDLDAERHKIMFFLNQKPLDFSWCNVGLCNWSQVKSRLNTFTTEDCALSFCTGQNSATTAHRILLLPVLTAFIIIVRYFVR